MDTPYISDIEDVEHYLGELFHLPVGVCIADTQDIGLNALGYEIPDMHRQPDSHCSRAFQYVARIEWAPWKDEKNWKLMYALYRREIGRLSQPSSAVDEIERRPLREMPIEVQEYAHRYLSQILAAAGGEWQLLRGMMSLTRRTQRKMIRAT